MKRIIDKRGTGKTKQLLEYAWSNGGVVVCSNPCSMKQKAEAYGFYGLKFISYNEYYYHPLTEEKFVIDELERILPNNITGYTITNED